jgi:hypothetical protein
MSTVQALDYMPSAFKREHIALQKNTFLHFLFVCVIFAHMNPNPDPVTKIKADPCESGSTTVDTLIKKKGDLHLGCSSAKSHI